MNKNQFREKPQDSVFEQTRPRWLATFTEAVPLELNGFECQAVAGDVRSRKLYLATAANSTPPMCAEHAGRGVILDGQLFNRNDLQQELGAFLAPAGSSDAEIILAAYLRWGEDLLMRLRGAFALLIWDTDRQSLLCLRDPLGTYPMFYADASAGLIVSTSIEVLTAHPQVSSALNRAALADYFLDRFPRLEETFFEAVKRVPPGHVLRLRREDRKTYRYWDPAPGGVTKWLTAQEVERFDELFDQAVNRCLSLGPAGIFLSGGLDSVSVAAAAVEQSNLKGLANPLALSLIFPDPEMSEEIVQRSVATQLGLPQVLKPFYEAVGSNQLLAPAIEMSRALPAPLMNTWLPAYYGLALEGKRRGYRTILTGNGGDEWLTISPYLAADFLRGLNAAGMYELWRSLRRSNRRSGATLLRSLVWRFGLQPLLLPPLQRVIKQTAPWALKLRRRVSPDLPGWLAPDVSLRRELKLRREEYAVNKQKFSGQSFYVQQMRKALYHPLISWELEEYFNIYEAVGLHLLQPFWDADLVDLLYRTPPLMLDHDGRNKGLVRASLARKFPQLGFERQVKLEATQFYASSVHNEAGAIWKKLENARTLGELGIVDEWALRPEMHQLMSRRQPGSAAHRVWSVLNLEAWARAHVS